MKYPNIKNALFVVIATALIGGAFVVAEYKNKEPEQVYRAPELVTPAIATASEKDSDNDGLKDWEEILLGSDPSDAKSKARASTTPTVKDLTAKKDADLAPIDVVSREFFSRYMELRQLGIAQDELSQQELVQKTINGVTLSEPKAYTSADIKTDADISIENIKRYGNNVANVFKTYAIQSRNEGVIAREAFEKEDPTILKELDPVIESYKKIVNALVAIKAPQSVAVMHLDLVNGMNTALFSVNALRKGNDDPILGVSGASQYLQASARTLEAMKGIKSYLTYLGITYTASEPGSMFVPAQY